MTDNELRQVIEFLIRKTRELIPISSNIDKDGNLLKKRSINESLKLYAKWAWTRNLHEKKVINTLYDWKMDEQPCKEEEIARLKNISEKLKKYSSVYNKKKHKNNSAYTYLEKLEEEASRGVFWGIENCGGLSALLTLMAAEYNKNGMNGLPAIDEKIYVTLVAINPHYDHRFVLFSRREIFNWLRPYENLNTFVVDAHTGEFYQIREVWIEEKKFKHLDGIFNTMPLWRVDYQIYLSAEFNGENAHSAKWQSRTSSNTVKWWKAGQFLDMEPMLITRKPRDYKAFYENYIIAMKDKIYSDAVMGILRLDLSFLQSADIHIIYDAIPFDVGAKKIFDKLRWLLIDNETPKYRMAAEVVTALTSYNATTPIGFQITDVQFEIDGMTDPFTKALGSDQSCNNAEVADELPNNGKQGNFSDNTAFLNTINIYWKERRVQPEKLIPEGCQIFEETVNELTSQGWVIGSSSRFF